MLTEPIPALALSVFPGAGHFYAKQKKIGYALTFAAIGSFLIENITAYSALVVLSIAWMIITLRQERRALIH